jgi:indolepyruvate ferredoxin oxidoreductase
MAADGEVERAIRIAALPDMVRGYEDVKLANVARYREALVSCTGNSQHKL